MKAKYLEIILAIFLLVTIVSGFGVTWTETSASGSSVAISADGRIILAVPSTSPRPAISTNWGQTWTSLTNTPSYGNGYAGGVAMSADGATIFAVLSSAPARVFISTNYGGTWTPTGLSNMTSELVVACSADATKLIAGVLYNSPTYYSTNTGVNWYPSSVINASQNENWESVASSADGELMTAVVNGGNLYFSTDFGALWAPANLPAQSWKSVCVSSDGNWAGATSASGTYISSNAGFSWITNKLTGGRIACSANGTNWIIAGAQLYISSNGGVTWVTNLSPVGGYDAAVSADGYEFVVSYGDVWIGRSVPSPQLSIQSSNGNVALSWLLPSTNFVLEQNADLSTTDWVTVSNSPILNFTNLQDEITVPASASNGFFRLTAQ